MHARYGAPEDISLLSEEWKDSVSDGKNRRPAHRKPARKGKRGGRGGSERVYSEALADAICAWIAEGKTLRDFCRQEGAPSYRAVYDWLEAKEDFASRFARARELGYDVIAQEALAIADTTQPGEIRTVEDGEDGVKEKVVTEDMLGHRKLRVWTRLQLLARWDPKRYGERQQLEHSGGVSLQVITGVPRE